MQKEEEKPLPEGYTRVDWVKSDGTATANLGIVATSEMALEVDMKYDIVSAAKSNHILGYNGLGKRAVAIVGGVGKNAVRGQYNKTAGLPSIDADGTREKFTFQCKDASQILAVVKEGTVISSVSQSQPAEGFEAGYQMSLGTNPKAQIYGCAIYSDFDMETKIFNGIPCQQDSDEQYGLYDTISQAFYGNTAGSGAYTGGYD